MRCPRSSSRYRDDHRLLDDAGLDAAAEVTPVVEIVGPICHYRFTPGTPCRLMWEDFGRLVGKQPASAAA
jgi:hypothetical protein